MVEVFGPVVEGLVVLVFVGEGFGGMEGLLTQPTKASATQGMSSSARGATVTTLTRSRPAFSGSRSTKVSWVASAARGAWVGERGQSSFILLL